MKITKETVEHIAGLANLKFSPEQLKIYTQKFARVMEYVEKLNELKTADIEPTAHALETTCGLREDTVKKFDEADKIMESAPEKDGRFVQVPKVI